MTRRLEATADEVARLLMALPPHTPLRFQYHGRHLLVGPGDEPIVTALAEIRGQTVAELIAGAP